jgi:hypothetical protein
MPTAFAALASAPTIMELPSLADLAPTIEIPSALKPASPVKIASVKFPRLLEPAPAIKIMLAEFTLSKAPESPVTIAKHEPVAIVEPIHIPPTAEVIRSIVRRTQIIKVVPGPCAHKHAVNKPLRPVVAIGSASERVCRIESPLTDRRRVISPVVWANMDANPNRNLCLRMDRGHCQYSQQQSKILQISHFFEPS